MPREHVGFREAFSIGVGGMIGGGIFAVLGLSLQLAGAGAPAAFLLAGLVALSTAYSYMKLTRRYPSRGGTVEFLVRAYGSGLVSGGLNVLLVLAYTVMIALYAYAFGEYAASSFGGEWAWARSLSIAVIELFAFVNALGAVVSGKVEDGLVFFKLGVLLFVASAVIPFVDWDRLSPSNWPPPTMIVAGGMIIFLAYEGFELIANASADAERVEDVVKAYPAAVVTVIGVYILIAAIAAGAMSLEEVERARDYALAQLASVPLGRPGFLLVVAAALASTASAINATLYGTAGISYIVARYGQLPESVGKRIWGHAPEGLVIISLLSSILVLGSGLEAISFAGSASFLVIFSAVNLAAYRLRREAKASPVVTLGGLILTLVSLSILTYHTLVVSPGQVGLFALTAVGAFAVEGLYKSLTGRRLREYMDPLLEERERLKKEWDKWVPGVLRAIGRSVGEFEAYLIGGVARGEHRSSHDVDILVVVKKPTMTSRELERRVRKSTGLPRHHPLHIHLVSREERDEYLKRSRKYRKLHPKE